MKAIVILLSLAGLAGCAAVGGAAKPVIGYYDFGHVTPAVAAPAIPLRSLGVFAPSWLGNAAMQYRLAYADATRRETYSASRWAAPPAELLEHGLRRQFGATSEAATSSSRTSAAGCRLRVDIDEFSQVFDSPTRSHAKLEARLSLWPLRGEPALAQHSLRLAQPAATADAGGGVAAFSLVAGTAGTEIAAWLEKLARETPALIERCRSV